MGTKVTLSSGSVLEEPEIQEHGSSSLGRQCQMASAENNTSGPAPSPVPQCSKRRLITADQASVVNVKWCLLKITLQAPPRSSMFKRRLITADQASVFIGIMSVHISSGLVLHQMTSDHNRSELGILVHSNDPSSSNLVPKVVPLAVKTTTS
ncbi:hypothetical protein Tco_0988249 [Tanacetum coccineum]|uniref:Uncharacterized protein n=1 Tax=Tanacetum coccineum TaxID=301880 RepID=A0ABQ5EQL3_9ASTR